MSFNINVVEANLKRDTSSLSTMDPFVTLKCGAFQQKTTTHKNGGKKPRWNQTLALPNVQNTIMLQVIDQQTFMNEVICSANIDTTKFIEFEEETEQLIQLFYDSKNSGKIKIKVTYNNPQSNYRPQNSSMPPQYIPQNNQIMNMQPRGPMPRMASQMPMPNRPIPTQMISPQQSQMQGAYFQNKNQEKPQKQTPSKSDEQVQQEKQKNQSGDSKQAVNMIQQAMKIAVSGGQNVPNQGAYPNQGQYMPNQGQYMPNQGQYPQGQYQQYPQGQYPQSGYTQPNVQGNYPQNPYPQGVNPQMNSQGNPQQFFNQYSQQQQPQKKGMSWGQGW